MESEVAAGKALDETICEICQKQPTDWMKLCRSCKTMYCDECEKRLERVFCCPQCTRRLQKGSAGPDTQLGGIAGNSQESGSQRGVKRKREDKIREEKCPTAEETTTLFCEEHEEANCPQCEKSQAHSSHKMLCAEDAAQKCKAKLLKILSHVKQEEKTSEWRDAESALNRIKGKVVYKPPKLKELPKDMRADVTLDPDTANPWLVVSPDRKSVEWNVEQTEQPHNPKRFCFEPCVLGSEGFTSGRHYWEVDVGDGRAWAVGVVRESVKRTEWINLIPQEGIYALEQCGGQCWAPTSPKRPMSLSPRRVGVYLDYDAGRLVFYNSGTEEPICHSLLIPLKGEKIFPFFWGLAKLRLCPHAVGSGNRNQPSQVVPPFQIEQKQGEFDATKIK